MRERFGVSGLGGDVERRRFHPELQQPSNRSTVADATGVHRWGEAKRSAQPNAPRKCRSLASRLLLAACLLLAVNLRLRASILRDAGGPSRPTSATLPSVLPKRLISVFGLESSGTTFVWNALSEALGATREVRTQMEARNPDGSIWTQHLSLPSGPIGRLPPPAPRLPADAGGDRPDGRARVPPEPLPVRRFF
ncbi:hypothetical protein ACHAWF_014815 [Thalassiosira exigua]